MAADAQGQMPIFDYPVVSDGGPKEPPKPGDKWDETVWKEEPPGSWEHGDQSIGTVGVQAKGPAGSPRFEADFTFTKPPSSVQVDGDVPGGDGWQGPGRGRARGPKPDKDVPIEFRNPKRWG
jgi:hypothetical protein